MSAPHSSKTAAVAILAGGEGRRLGGGKPQAQLAGRPLLAHTLAAAAATGLETVVVAKRDSPLPPLPCKVLYEPDAPMHPLCGIVTALSRLERPVVGVGCDMPFLSASLIGRLAGLHRPAVVTLRGEPQPLLARWTPAQLPALEAALSASLPLRRAIAGLPDELAPMTIDETALTPFGDLEMACFNVNDRDDLKRAEGMLLEGGA